MRAVVATAVNFILSIRYSVRKRDVYQGYEIKWMNEGVFDRRILLWEQWKLWIWLWSMVVMHFCTCDPKLLWGCGWCDEGQPTLNRWSVSRIWCNRQKRNNTEYYGTFEHALRLSNSHIVILKYLPPLLLVPLLVVKNWVVLNVMGAVRVRFGANLVRTTVRSDPNKTLFFHSITTNLENHHHHDNDSIVTTPTPIPPNTM